MKIALIGYGKMGQIVERLAIQKGHIVTGYMNSKQWDMEALNNADICIDFTNPECIVDNMKRMAQLNKNIVVGTTGWDDRADMVRELVARHQIGLLYSPNFSIGVNVVFETLTYMAKLFNAFEEYDVSGIEYHHNKKRDTPSGTGLKMAKIVETNIDRIVKLPFASVRCGSIPGTHTVLFDSLCDTVSITHEARNREGFAHGAVLAAEWLYGKRGLYTFADCLNEIIQRRSL